VTIGLPVYNGERYLREAVDSILAQTFRDFELVISDNASSDDTEAVARAYAQRDPRVRYVRNQQNIGGFRNHNQVVALARGEFFGWGAHDDVWAPTYLEGLVAELERRPEVVLSFPQIEWIDGRGARLEREHFWPRIASEEIRVRFRDLIRLNHMLDPIYGLIRTAILRRTGLLGSYADSDRVLLAELALYGPFAQASRVLFYRRRHAAQSTQVHPSRYDRRAWIDPARSGRLVFPHFRQLGEYVQAIRRASPPAAVRRQLYRELAHWIPMNREGLTSDLEFAARHVVRRLAPARLLQWRRERRAGRRGVETA
jgi:glycosyltransferase involved in cell wall biosynthesis